MLSALNNSLREKLSVKKMCANDKMHCLFPTFISTDFIKKIHFLLPYSSVLDCELLNSYKGVSAQFTAQVYLLTLSVTQRPFRVQTRVIEGWQADSRGNRWRSAQFICGDEQEAKRPMLCHNKV